MRRHQVLALVIAAFAQAGAALAEPCDRPTDITVAVTAAPTQVDGKEVLSRTAYSCGHFWSSANLQEKSLAENGNALERFNLASAYARTGRYAQAEALYQSVVRDGQFLNVRMDTAFTGSGAGPTGFNLSDEAARRLTALAYVRRLYEAPAVQTAASPVQLAPTPLSALDAGVNAADVTPSAEPVSTPTTPVAPATAPVALSADAFGLNAADVTGVSPVSDQEALQRDGLAPVPTL